MTVAVTPLYAAVLTILVLGLSVRVILRRRAASISVGDGGDKELRKRMRVQANCIEYAPLGIVLLLLVEVLGAAALTVHELGLMLVTGRIMHAIGMSITPQVVPLRVIGMALTFTMLGLSAVLILYLHLF